MLKNGDLDSDEHASGEHDGSNSKTIGVGQICKTATITMVTTIRVQLKAGM
jgi:hypothetical protein